MKVKDLAKELGQNIETFMGFLNEVDIRIKSPSTKLKPKTVRIIKDLFNEKPKGDTADTEETETKRESVTLPNQTIKIGELATAINVPLSDIMHAILSKGLLLNQNSDITMDLAIDIADLLNIDIVCEGTTSKTNDSLKDKLNEIELNEMDKNKKSLSKRPPIITVMGHVDHGKTKLLDAIRETNVADGESGGITQHIGAYQVTFEGHLLTFLDTPGHEAFTSLRSRGAQVTDIAILIVAADEGVKPQTIEAINHAKAANVPIIVALNKTDKPNANVDQCKKELADHDLLAEDWGGKTIMAPISALEKTGISDLLNMILLVAEMQELQATETTPAKGVVIESTLSKQKGPIATLLVKSGTLRTGDNLYSGYSYGKVKALINDKGQNISEAGPGTPVELLGFNDVPAPGELFEVEHTEKEARTKANAIQSQTESGNIKQVSLETLSQQIEEGNVKKLNLVIKSDVHGSIEAIIASIENIPSDEVSIQILHSATGPVTENDVMLAKASEAVIIGFGLPENNEMKAIANQNNVNIKYYNIIYNIIDDIKKAAEGLFTVEYEEIEIGEAEVRDLFKFSKVGIIAGSYVLSGKIIRNSLIKVFRENKEVFNGKLTSLKRFKDDVKEVAAGYECGIVLDGFNELQENDLIKCLKLEEKKRTL